MVLLEGLEAIKFTDIHLDMLEEARRLRKDKIARRDIALTCDAKTVGLGTLSLALPALVLRWFDLVPGGSSYLAAIVGTLLGLAVSMVMNFRRQTAEVNAYHQAHMDEFIWAEDFLRLDAEIDAHNTDLACAQMLIGRSKLPATETLEWIADENERVRLMLCHRSLQFARRHIDKLENAQK